MVKTLKLGQLISQGIRAILTNPENLLLSHHSSEIIKKMSTIDRSCAAFVSNWTKKVQVPQGGFPASTLHKSVQHLTLSHHPLDEDLPIRFTYDAVSTPIDSKFFQKNPHFSFSNIGHDIRGGNEILNSIVKGNIGTLVPGNPFIGMPAVHMWSDFSGRRLMSMYLNRDEYPQMYCDATAIFGKLIDPKEAGAHVDAKWFQLADVVTVSSEHNAEIKLSAIKHKKGAVEILDADHCAKTLARHVCYLTILCEQFNNLHKIYATGFPNYPLHDKDPFEHLPPIDAARVVIEAGRDMLKNSPALSDFNLAADTFNNSVEAGLSAIKNACVHPQMQKAHGLELLNQVPKGMLKNPFFNIEPEKKPWQKIG